MTQLTKRQGEILLYIMEYAFEHLYQPDFGEISTKFGISSKQGVFDHLKALERKGFINRVRGRTRAVDLLQPAWDFYDGKID